MAPKRKPLRNFVEDDNAREELTRLPRRSQAEVAHEAPVEYLVHHREELTQLYDQAQRAILRRWHSPPRPHGGQRSTPSWQTCLHSAEGGSGAEPSGTLTATCGYPIEDLGFLSADC
jgi:hypothetical protein